MMCSANTRFEFLQREEKFSLGLEKNVRQPEEACGGHVGTQGRTMVIW
jgi:hypothetical protein